ncbi:MAG TPA: AI-2E family transporter [Pyrinomonadaceae bacterium]|nr:AI-2E family transporter [Pyrinomonadaceae bacterium]
MTPNNPKQLTYTSKVLIAVAITVTTYLLYQLFFQILDVVLLTFAGILLAIFLRGLADFVNRYTKLSETMSVLLVSVLLLGILAGAIALLAPDVAEQIKLLRGKLPDSVQKLSDYFSQFSWGRTVIEQFPNNEAIRDKINNLDFSSLLTRVGGYFSSTVGAIGNFFVVILLAIYLAVEPKFYTKGLTKIFPIASRPRVEQVLGEIGNTLTWWLIGKTASMLFIGILTWIGLSILGVPLALTLGLIAGLLSFIPNFGPIFSAVPAILLAFIDSPIKALYVLGLFIIVQIIESNIVTPFIERRTVELPPALTIIAQIALGVLLGGLGLVLATPLLTVIIVLVQMVYVEDVLGDKNTEAEEKTEDIQRKDTKTQRRKDLKEEIKTETTE